MGKAIGAIVGASYGALCSTAGALNLVMHSACDAIFGNFSISEMARCYPLDTLGEKVSYFVSLPALFPAIAYEQLTGRNLANSPSESGLVLALTTGIFAGVGFAVQKGIEKIISKLYKPRH